MGEAREGDWDCAGCENRNYAFRSFCNRCKLPRRGEGKEGDWDCGGCHNRNYAFRSFCNRCKQPRLLVDTKTPTDSKWLPRIGDWICSGCSNNNYASREKCKKCGQPKEEAAMPAMSMRGASLPAHAPYFSRGQDLPGLKMYGMGGNPALQQLLQPNSSWSFGGTPKYGLQSTPNWPFNGTGSTGFSQNTNPLGVPKGWRSGDWLCNCGFHNYSSRTQCKECNAPLPSGAPSSAVNSAAPDIYPTLGTKRLASEEFVNDWDHKRLNTRDINNHFLTTGQQQSFLGFEQLAGTSNGLLPGVYSRYPTGNSTNVTSMQGNVQSPHLTMPALIGKGAKQWRDGDWMCSNCDNHNYASRSSCNRCKTPKEAAAEVGTAV